MTPRVSVIIPTRNRAGLLAQALDSVFAQKGAGTEFDMDVVVVDDASTDATTEVVARYSSARHIRLWKAQGAGHARNVAIEETTGTFVAFLDDDDLWLPDKLSRQVGALRAAPGSGVAYSQVLIGGRGGYIFPERHAPSGALFHHLLLVNLCMIAAVLVRREALTTVGGFGDGLLEDYDMWLRLASHVPFLFVPGIVAVYRPSTEGVYQTAVRSGEHRAALRRIVWNALATLPPTETSEPIICGVLPGPKITVDVRPGRIRKRVSTAPMRPPKTGGLPLTAWNASLRVPTMGWSVAISASSAAMPSKVTSGPC